MKQDYKISYFFIVIQNDDDLKALTNLQLFNSYHIIRLKKEISLVLVETLRDLIKKTQTTTIIKFNFTQDITILPSICVY